MNTSTKISALEIAASRRPIRSFACRDILREIETRLTALITAGQASSIDMTHRPMHAEEYRQLRLALATGRVNAVVTEPSRCEVRETTFPGVWWVTRYDTPEEPCAEAIAVAFAIESIEISFMPSILRSSTEEARRALHRLSGGACERETRQRRRGVATSG